MKKIYLSLLFLSVMSSITGSAIAIDENTQKNTKLNKLQKQYRESMDRLKKCARGKCSRLEAAKAVRDLAIIIAAITAGSYATGTGLIRGADYLAIKGYQSAGDMMFGIGRMMRKPITPIVSKFISPPFKEGQLVKLRQEFSHLVPNYSNMTVKRFDYPSGYVKVKYLYPKNNDSYTTFINPLYLIERNP